MSEEKKQGRAGKIITNIKDSQSKKKLRENAFRRNSARLKKSNTKLLESSHIYVDINSNESTLFYRKDDKLQRYDILTDEKRNQEYVILEINPTLETKTYNYENQDFSFDGYIAKYELR